MASSLLYYLHVYRINLIFGEDKMINKRILITGIFSLFMCNAALATIIPPNLAVDFRTAPWSGAYGNTSWTVGSVTATASYPDKTATLYQDSIDGMGILTPGYERDEIDTQELLTVTFGSSAQFTGVWITDLFKRTDGGVGERGEVCINSGASCFQFDGNYSDQGNGEQFVAFAGGASIAVADAVFRVRNDIDGVNPNNNEFSVAGFVPEPGPLALLGISLVALGVSSMRRKKLA